MEAVALCSGLAALLSLLLMTMKAMTEKSKSMPHMI